jgi:[ribosomal protein S18]-alanine N-acetyltransferase
MAFYCFRMNYRLFHPDDFAQMYAVEEVCFQPPVRFPRRYMRRLVDNPDSITWVAEEQGRIAGFSIIDFGSDEDGLFAYIETIEVLPDHRGRGIGNQLLARVEGSARDRGAIAIWLHVEYTNASAIRLYESQQYKCMGRQENFYARSRAAFIYCKELEARS